MNYRQFVTMTKEKVSSELPEPIQVYTHNALKYNGYERIGLTISDERRNISPSIYLEEFYQHYQEGRTIEDIVENILEIYHSVDFDCFQKISDIKDFSATQSKIVFRLINCELNESLLKSMPYIEYLDLAIVFYILFEINENEMSHIPITNELLRYWNTTKEDLYRIALGNATCLLPATLKPMQTLISELMGEPIKSDLFEQDPMYVLTNQYRSFGASCILYPEILEQIFGQFGENYYILPSSVHETIFIPETQSPGKEILLDMVKEINDTQLEREEILSDNIYHYVERQLLIIDAF